MGDLRDIRDGRGKVDNKPSNGLTPIPLRIHCPATPDRDEVNGHDELERIDIDNFLSTLAEIAATVAWREQQDNEHESGSVHQGQ